MKYFGLCLGMDTGIGFVQQNNLHNFRNGSMNESESSGRMEITFYRQCNQTTSVKLLVMLRSCEKYLKSRRDSGTCHCLLLPVKVLLSYH